jgi:hypothetical protein
MQDRGDKAWEHRTANYAQWKKRPAEQVDRQQPACPGEKPVIKHVYRKGSLLGLANDMQKYRGRATILKHEGKSWLNGLMTSSSAAGTMDEFNELMDHELYSNSVLTTGHDILVYNPHLCAYIAMHAGELIEMAESGRDTTGGLQRFSLLHVLSVSNKMLPEGSPDVLDDLRA